MNKKKQAGIERPYTWGELKEMMETFCDEQNVVMYHELDYWLTDDKARNEPVVDIEWDFISKTHFGSNEGIYTDFYCNRGWGHEPLSICTAKTLSTSDKAYIGMHEFAARVELALGRYIDKHMDEFNWRGYDVGYWKDGERKPYMWTIDHNRALDYAKEAKGKDGKAYIRDNATREYEEI